MLGTAADWWQRSIASRSLAAYVGTMDSDRQPARHVARLSRVFGFAALIAVVSAVLIGLIPALQATAGNLSDHIKDGQHARQAHERRGFCRVLLASEVAVAVMLLVGAGLLATSLVRLFQSGVGFDPKGLVNIAFNMDKQQLGRRCADAALPATGRWTEPPARSEECELPVHCAACPGGWNENYSTPEGSTHLIFLNSVGPDYFRTMRMPLFTGTRIQLERHQDFGAEDHLESDCGEAVFPAGMRLDSRC